MTATNLHQTPQSQRILSGDVTAFDLRDSRDGHAHPDGDLLLGQLPPLAHLGQPSAAPRAKRRVSADPRTIALRAFAED